MSDRGRWGLVALAYGASFLAVVLATRPGWRAQPLFARFRVDAERSWIQVTHERPLELVFTQQGAAPRSLSLPVRVPGRGRPLEVQVWSEPDGTLLGRAEIESSGLGRVPLEPAGGERLRVELRSLGTDREAPSVAAAELAPRFDAVLTDPGGQDAPGGPRAPLLHLDFQGQRAVWLALLLVPLVIGLLARRALDSATTRQVVLAATAFACAVLSLLLWERFRSINSAAGDPDAYGRAAQVLADLLRGDTSWEEARAWFHRYPHAHTALISFALMPLLALGVEMHVAYLMGNALLGLATLAAFDRLLAGRLRLAGSARILGGAAFAAHLVVVRAFARPSPDVLGLLLVVLSLELVLERFERARPGARRSLGLLVLLHVLARPQGPVIAGLTVLAFALADLRRLGRPEALRSLGVGALPLVILVPLYLAFGWLHNFDLALKKAANFHDEWTLLGLGVSLVATLQLLPLAWLGTADRGDGAEKRTAARTLLLWVGIYVLMMVVVRAPLWPRHFLPAVPGVVALAALGARGDSARQSMARLVLAGTAALNLLVLGAQLVRFLPWLHAYQVRRLPEVAFRVLYE